jgi:type IV secretory pathway VirB4 component
MRAWTHWATSSDLVSLRMPSHDAGTGLQGRPLGRAVRGHEFAFDPFDAYGAGLVTNPNVVVAGSIGAGKSTVVKMLLDRALARGRRVVVVDPKGEYGELARAHGVRSVALGRDGWCDPFGEHDRDGLDLARALLASAQGSALSNEQHFALDVTWRRLATPRPARVLRALYDVLEGHLGDDASSPTRSLALSLYRFVSGDLAGLFDGEEAPLTLDGDLVVLDLSAQWSASSLPVAALSAVAAAQRLAAAEGGLGYLVLDEAWVLLADDAALRWLQGSWKLARSRGLSHLLVLHRWSDVGAAGGEGSAARERARGLLRECETAWLFRQPPDETREMTVALGLSEREARYLAALPRGVALVRYGPHRSIVRVEPDARDARFIDTDAAMRACP